LRAECFSHTSGETFPNARKAIAVIPLDAEPDPSLAADAKALMAAGLGKAELEFIASITAPIFWMLRDDHGNEQIKGGSAFILDTGAEVFAVTAAHVVVECFEDSKLSNLVQCMIGSNGGLSIPLHLGDHVIDAHAGIDIATFRLSRKQIERIGKTPLTGFQKQWPPTLPRVGRGVTYCGFPGISRVLLARRKISFGCMPMGGIITSAHETRISIQVERENLMRVLGNEEFPEDFNFGGISGGPLLTIVQTPTIRSWMPAGVVIQGPNPSGNPDESISGLEIISARPVHFINPDGTLDVTRWEQSNFGRP
jgi:hypothetical protein